MILNLDEVFYLMIDNAEKLMQISSESEKLIKQVQIILNKFIYRISDSEQIKSTIQYNLKNQSPQIPNQIMEKDRQVIRKLKLISLISLLFMTVEILGGIMANSIAILADAFHLLSDVLAYIISLQAVIMSHRKAPLYLAFGYQKVQPLGALINVAIIWFVTIELLVQATERIINRSVVKDPLYMLLTSFFGLGCNLYIMKVLHSDTEHGGHAGCSHHHGHNHDHHGHNHNHDHHDHDHKHEHKHGKSCSHDHQLKKQEKKKCSHNHDHHDHDNHNHDHNDEHQHSMTTVHEHVHGENCNHEKNKYEIPDSYRDINSYTTSEESPKSTQNLNEPEQRSLEMQKSPMIGSTSRQELFKNINIQAAYIHIISDIILSIGVIISAILIYSFGDSENWTRWQLADPFCTYFFSIMAIYSTIGVTKDSVVILLDGCDDHDLVKEVGTELEKINGVYKYHDLKVWSVNRGKYVSAVKIQLENSIYEDPQLINKTLKKVTKMFESKGITHYVEIIGSQKEIKME